MPEQIDGFASCIRTGKRLALTGEEDLAAIALIEVMIRSVGSQLRVEIKTLMVHSTVNEGRRDLDYEIQI